ncbi:MAG TPA: carboxypeptidase-like regulatory domain-containing protein, partial [Acidobacteriaceae bacterium]|nr:carboxypeptidase-like regulatory domain-containing protein [Acidobacteriaceae bacterium]
MAVHFPCRVFIATCLLSLSFAMAAVLASVRGVVHDPQHRPIADATVTLHAANSDFVEEGKTNTDGEFSFSAVPAGDYFITAGQSGFDTARQSITVASNTSPVLHIELSVASVQQSVTVDTNTSAVNVDSITPTTLISREDIARTPGADRTNSLSMITDYVPGAYMTHDMLHMRGGHELSWLIDGVNIPNTNIASNI